MRRRDARPAGRPADPREPRRHGLHRHEGDAARDDLARGHDRARPHVVGDRAGHGQHARRRLRPGPPRRRARRPPPPPGLPVGARRVGRGARTRPRPRRPRPVGPRRRRLARPLPADVRDRRLADPRPPARDVPPRRRCRRPAAARARPRARARRGAPTAPRPGPAARARPRAGRPVASLCHRAPRTPRRHGGRRGRREHRVGPRDALGAHRFRSRARAGAAVDPPHGRHVPRRAAAGVAFGARGA